MGSFTWLQAKWDAHARGGHLAVITSLDEFAVVEALNPGDKFLGGTDAFVEGEWKWVTNEDYVDLDKWAVGQPDNAEGYQDYLRITDDSPPYSYLIDDCANHEVFISGYILETPIVNTNDIDSDDDGLSDGDEVNTHGTDPNDADSDDDGLSDGDEVNTHSTDPNDADSDNDGLSDGHEVLTQYRPQ